MASNPIHYYTLEEYFAVENAGDARYEYWDGEIVCMSGGSKEHIRISSRIHVRLSTQLEDRGGSCEAFTGDLAIKNLASGPPYFYPDASAACGEARFERIRGIDVLLNPILIAEVISPTSETRDKGSKLELYKLIPSLREYLIVAQDKPEVIHHFNDDGGNWTMETVSGLSMIVIMPSIECRLALADLYKNIEFNSI